MNYQHIVFTKPQVAELLPYEIEDPAADQVQIALERSTISSGTERANLMGSTTVAWNQPEAKDAPAIFGRLCRENAFPIVQFDWSELR